MHIMASARKKLEMLFVSWQENFLFIFSSQNLLFLGLSFKTIAQTLVTMLKSGSLIILVLLCIAGKLALYYYGTLVSGYNWYSWFVLLLSLYSLFLYSIHLRASINRKSMSYWLQKSLCFFPLYLIISLVYAGVALFIFSIIFSRVIIPSVVITIMAHGALIIISASALSFLTIFFIVDSGSSLLSALRAPVRALLLILYNVPYIVGIGLLVYAITLGLTMLLYYSFLYWHALDFFLVQKIVICVCALPWLGALASNFYIKRIHEQMRVYYACE